MTVSATHAEYKEVCKKWDLVRSVVTNNAAHWIRTVDRNDPLRSDQYRKDAILTNFTRLTKIGLTGLVFRKPTKIDLPDEIEYLKEDATGYNFGIEQLAQQCIGEVLTAGRYGLLVDYPTDPAMGEYARIKPYAAETIINWRYEAYGSEHKITLVVLKEKIEVIDPDGFGSEMIDQYRVLKLNKDGIYQQEIYNNKEELVSILIPLDYNGSPLYEVPFAFIGSENNDGCIDSIPLYDLAVVNLGHYRNSADYEESVFITGQPFLVVNIGETNEQDFKQANPNGLQFGSRSGLIVSAGGGADLLQANPNQLADAAMKRKEEQAAAIGARLIAPPGGRETAEAARIRFGSQNSALYMITKNVSKAFEMCLDWCAEFMMEVPGETEFELNDQFYEENADPNLIAQEIMLFDRKLMSANEVRENLDKSGIKLDEEFQPTEASPMDPQEDL